MAKNSGKDVTKFDAAEYLDNPEVIAAYLSEAFDTQDKAFISEALNTVARSRGMADIAVKVGSSRESLYKSFDGKTEPQFSTVQKVLDAMDLKLEVRPKEQAA